MLADDNDSYYHNYINKPLFKNLLILDAHFDMKTNMIFALVLFVLSPMAMAATPQYKLVISDHRFEPAEITIPANTRVKLEVVNKDKTPEEFESHSLHREKIIGGLQTGYINIGPLSPGVYEFVGEFHEDTAKGRIIVK